MVSTSKTVKALVETPAWIEGLSPMEHYQRKSDDGDGAFLRVLIDEQGDCWLYVQSEETWNIQINGSTKERKKIHKAAGVRFCMPYGGGGRSSRTRMALMVLAEAIRLDNKEDPGWAKP